MSERIETVQNIPAEELQKGGFAFQLPEGTPEDEQKAFEQVVSEAKEKGLNLVLKPGVKVVDLKTPIPTPTPQPAVVETPKETVPETKVEEAKVEAPKEEVKTTPTPQEAPQAPPAFYSQGFGYQPGTVPYQYTPFPPMGYPIPPPQPVMPTGQPMFYYPVMPNHVQVAPPKQESPKENK